MLQDVYKAPTSETQASVKFGASKHLKDWESRTSPLKSVISF